MDVDTELGAFAELAEGLDAAVPVAYLPEDVASLLQGLSLQAAAAQLARADLWAEAALLERLLYKSRSQHRGARHFQRLLEVRRTLRTLRRLALPPTLCALAACLPDAPPRCARLPSSAHGVHVARRLLCAATLCASARQPLARAAAECSALLGASYFMPLALVSLALCARCASLLRATLARCALTYNALAPLLPLLPPPCQAGGAQLPQLLRCEWAAPAAGAPDVLHALGHLQQAQPGAHELLLLPRGDAEEDAGAPVARAFDRPLVFEDRSAQAGDAGAWELQPPRYAVLPMLGAQSGAARPASRGRGGRGRARGSRDDALALLLGGTAHGTDAR